MFEFIGIVVVAWLGFKLLRSALRLLNRTLENAAAGMKIESIEYAKSQGVPRDFAVAMWRDDETVKFAAKAVSTIEPECSKLKAFERYGRGIVYLYACHLKEEIKKEEGRIPQKIASNKNRLSSFIESQLDAIEGENLYLHLNEVTYAYVAALANAMIESSINIEQTHDLVTDIFRDRPKSSIQHAYAIVQGAKEDFQEKVSALMPVAKEELAEGKGGYLLKYMRKVNSDLANQDRGEAKPRRDLSRVGLDEYLGLDV